MDLLRRVAALPPAKREKFLAGLDKAELAELEALTEGLRDFVPRVSPNLEAPRHLGPIVDLLERCEAEPIQATASTPPQHGKTETCIHGLVQLLRRNPGKRHAYVTYASDRAQAMSAKGRQIAEAAGLRVGGTLARWTTKAGGGVVWTGIGGPLTGYGINGLLLVDDPVKNRAEAESALIRERTDQWFRDVALTRCHPGASKLVVQTRWHHDDLAGRLNARGWKKVNLPAIDGEGRALWPEQRPADFLALVRKEVGEYTWASLYQGEPRPRGGAVFQDVVLCEGIPTGGALQWAIGLDLAYSAKTQSDWSVAVVLLRVSDPKNPAALPVFYVVEVVRLQVKAPAFKQQIRALQARYPFAKTRWYAAGVENGIGDFLQIGDGVDPGVQVEVLPAVGDKFVRAQPFAAAWNAGRVLVPRGAPWAAEFLVELASFTGLNDPHDDQVDALAAAYDLLAPTLAGDQLARRLAAFRGVVG